jgi:hypothetical protein
LDFVEEKTQKIIKTAFLLVWDKDSCTEIPSVASMHLCTERKGYFKKHKNSTISNHPLK